MRIAAVSGGVADDIDGTLHAGYPPRPARWRSGRKRAPVVGQRFKALPENRGGIDDAFIVALDVGRRSLRPDVTGRRDGRSDGRPDCRCRRVEIVARVQRLERTRVVPVVEMAAMALHAFDCGQGPLEPVDGFGQADPAEIAPPTRSTENRARYWSATCVLRRPCCGVLLEIVRRQHVVLVGDKSPRSRAMGATGDAAQLHQIRGPDVKPVLGYGRSG